MAYIFVNVNRSVGTITDFSSVFHKGLLHFMILMKREEKHHNYKQNQRQSKFFINKKEKNKSSDNFD